MNGSSICLKPINDLLVGEQGQPTRFWIPAYQRGFRWTQLQVTQLLDDVWEFIQSSDGRSRQAFYCLQPLVIRAWADGRFEVVDGQQRLTTIYILLTYLKKVMLLMEKEKFQIDFETRDNAFLREIDGTRAEENVDFFYICEAYKAIKAWFEKRDTSHHLKFLQHLLNDDEAGRNVKFIWFQLAEGDNPVSAFTRLNVGKIPLTNDELIRALFLNRIAPEETESTKSQLQIANEWDQLEKALQNDAFWYFLTNQNRNGQNRIGFLFELLVEAEKLQDATKHDAYYIFYAYNQKLKNNNTTLEEEWLEVKQAFMTLEEWFEDRKLYHIVGFLIYEGVDINEIRVWSKQNTKRAFEQKLKEKVFEKSIEAKSLNELNKEELLEIVEETLYNLEYHRDKPKIRSILLLFNLVTLIKDSRSNLRFQFDSFKSDDWDIEHIRSVTSNRSERHGDRVAWFKLCLKYLESEEIETELCQELKEFVNLTAKDALDSDFERLYDYVLRVFKESEEEDEDNGIGNLTLLDSTTNRSYKNAVFAVKRQILLSLDQSGIFVPLCTRNVFLKCYSPQVDNVMFWYKTDRDEYLNEMIQTLVEFFAGTKETEYA